MERGRNGGGVGVRRVAKRQEQKVMTVAWRVAFIIGDGIFGFRWFGKEKVPLCAFAVGRLCGLCRGIKS